jgi:hypothetical protein
MTNNIYLDYGQKENTEIPAFFVGGYGTTQPSVFSYAHRYPPTKRAGFAFNRIVSSRQFVGCHNKTTKLPAHLRDLPFSKLVGEAETGTQHGLEKVEKNRNSAYGD